MNYSVLQCLIETTDVLALLQLLQNEGVGEHKPGLVKRSDEILGYSMIYARFPADTGIHLRQKRRGDLNDRDATHVNRSDKARDVSNDSAAESNYG